MDPIFNYIFMQIINLLLAIIDFVSEPIIGYSWTYGSREERLISESKAHILKIVHKGEIYSGLTYGLANFILKHDCYVENPEVLLKKENVSLFSFDTKYAIFVSCKPWENILDCEKHPFSWLAQYQRATHLILLPLNLFNRVAEEKIGDPKVKVTLIQMTSRCGSTLLTQILGRVPRVQAWSEPNALCYMQTMRNNGSLPDHQIDRLLKNTFRVLCQRNNSNVDHLVMKLNPICNGLVPDILKEFPRTKVIFNTRNMRASLKSLLELKARITQSAIMPKTIVSFYDWISYCAFYKEERDFWKKLQAKYGIHKFGIGRKKDLETWVFHFCLWYSSFFWIKNHAVKVVFYEDLVKDFRKEMGEIFDLLEIPQQHLDHALTATANDSQRDTLGKRPNLTATFIPTEEEFIDKLLMKAKLPFRFNDSCDQMKQHYKI